MQSFPRAKNIEWVIVSSTAETQRFAKFLKKLKIIFVGVLSLREIVSFLLIYTRARLDNLTCVLSYRLSSEKYLDFSLRILCGFATLREFGPITQSELGLCFFILSINMVSRWFAFTHSKRYRSFKHNKINLGVFVSLCLCVRKFFRLTCLVQFSFSWRGFSNDSPGPFFDRLAEIM